MGVCQLNLGSKNRSNLKGICDAPTTLQDYGTDWSSLYIFLLFKFMMSKVGHLNLNLNDPIHF